MRLEKESRLIVKIEECRSAKGIQLYIENEPFLVMGSGYHGEILDGILDEMKISYSKKNLPDGSSHAELEGKKYKVVGMLKGVIIDKEIKIAKYDVSAHYGIGPNKKHLKEIEPYLGEYSVKLLN